MCCKRVSNSRGGDGAVRLRKESSSVEEPAESTETAAADDEVGSRKKAIRDEPETEAADQESAAAAKEKVDMTNMNTKRKNTMMTKSPSELLLNVL
jgi:hypothetical protein